MRPGRTEALARYVAACTRLHEALLERGPFRADVRAARERCDRAAAALAATEAGR